MKIPSLLRSGEICWVAVRNPIENPEHGSGDGKPRPALLVHESGAGWVTLGTTTNSTFGNGTPRTRIPSEWWEGLYPALGGRAGYLWGDKATWVEGSDVRDHLGWAGPEVRAFAVRAVKNLSQAERADFVRLRGDELDLDGDPKA